MRSPSYERSGRTYSSPSNKNAPTCVQCFAQASLSETQQPRFYWGLVTRAPFASCVPKLQTLRRKADVQYKPYCLYKQSRHNESPYESLGTLRAKFSDASQGPTLKKQAYLRTASFRLAMLTLFCRARYLTSQNLRLV